MKEETKHVRPSWDEYFMKITEVVGERATCDRGKTGSIIVKDKRILVTGYVGAPAGVAHCDEVGHEMHTVIQEDGTQSKHCIRTTHAEQNAIANAARSGTVVEGGTIYTHMTPCYVCAKIIINSGIKRVVANKDYHGGKRSKEVFKEAGVEFVLLNQETETYSDMK
ncbi:MAG: cell division protein DedD [Candidatus Taylorbacteria bacterium CG10_big_fil_rev_8_21_14_0_10_41_48]|uniref:Cell division protein DedD n=1 Tax=Candidatus Taylorbacteria bacterium CG10_big_fil_rev_8_21_14_0_10_41_48 TaxID=1975024 RepID=A0A2M8LD86_9BACT|nr:MAG: cell division protein DedD [Candidatus Taylorbacteria bacterium CG10_big_fil_rev_8_21_14_0_10_41_48]